jgi:hypothetical protein
VQHSLTESKGAVLLLHHVSAIGRAAAVDDKTNFLSAAERNSDAYCLGTLALTCRAIGIGFCKQGGIRQN